MLTRNCILARYPAFMNTNFVCVHNNISREHVGEGARVYGESTTTATDELGAAP